MKESESDSPRLGGIPYRATSSVVIRILYPRVLEESNPNCFFRVAERFTWLKFGRASHWPASDPCPPPYASLPPLSATDRHLVTGLRSSKQ
ncbi:hypothetical protein TNIN_365181 [Trichonephila inaurata madagascariensis]|uniref:Uncharacterized protein n=1 Tax=Trichonephila inaurata madagascariensis TaxID=2747483 RepID=A0A8X7BRD8_9ARAC|nr:hypothetical protein TNIN_365181 [Trichonephila inaurata madagascariensis]